MRFTPLLTLTVVMFISAATASQPINNASLMPEYRPDSEVKMEGMSPDWVKTLVMAQFRIETATPEGTFAAATRVLDHFAETGVNGLWINPVYERDPNTKTTGFNGYGNYGPHTIESALTGTADIDGSFAAVRAFVDEAHERNIRVLFDIVTWGVAKSSPLVAQHEDWFLINGQRKEMFSGWGFNWAVPELREWFVAAAVDFILRTGADGFRCDLEPNITGYDLFAEIRKRLYEQGRKVVIISEFVNERRGVYDFEQVSVAWEKPIALDRAPDFFESGDYYLRTDIVDSIRTGKGIGEPRLQIAGKGGMFRFYTFNQACHDSLRTFVRGSRLRMGYQAILAPFIPLWNIGEEWDNPHDTSPEKGGVLYFNRIQWAKLDEPANRAFFEDVKKYIRIRRTYPEIFEYFPADHRDANILKIEIAGNTLPAYARTKGSRSVVVVPNASGAARNDEIRLPLKPLGLEGREIKVTDLLDGKVLPLTRDPEHAIFKAALEPDRLGVFLVE